MNLGNSRKTNLAGRTGWSAGLASCVLMGQFLAAQHGFAHSAHRDSEEKGTTVLSENIKLAVDVDSNWPTEHCFNVRSGDVVNYAFAGPHIASFGIHVHSESQGTVDLAQDLRLDAYEQRIAVAQEGGHFCFTWDKLGNSETDWQLELRYEVVR